MSRSRPIVFLTDYGLADEFVGVCHGVMAMIAPEARVIDLSHAVPRQDVLRGAITLGRSVPFMPPGAVYIAVVDPGVGSDRRAIAVRTASGADLVGPDNGLLSFAWDAHGGVAEAMEIASDSVVLKPVSRTFHGRDVFAPAGAHLAAGMALGEVGPAIAPETLRTLEMPGPMLAPGAIGTRVLGVDGFGNVQLNARAEDLEAAGIGDTLSIGGRVIPRVEVFADVPPGALAALFDSQGQLALVVNSGSAAETLGLPVGRGVVVESIDAPGA